MLRSFRNISAFRKLLLALVSMGFAIALASGLAHYHFTADLIAKSVRNQIDESLRSAIAYLEKTFIVPVSGNLRLLESSPVVDAVMMSLGDDLYLHRPEAERLFLALIRTQPDLYRSFRLIDSYGREKVVVEGGRRLRDYRVFEPGGADADAGAPAIADLFRRLRAAQPGDIELSGPLAAADGSYAMYAGIMKTDPDIGGFGGVILAELSLAGFLNYLSQVEILDASMFWVFDDRGHALLQPAETFAQFDPRPYLFDGVAVPEGGVVVSSSNIAAVDDIGITVAVSLSPNQHAGQVGSAVVITLAIMFAILFGASLVTVLVARHLTAPVRSLSKMVAAVGAGNLDAQVEEHWDGEFGQLARAFNAMIGRIKQTTVSKTYVDNIIDSMSDGLIVLTDEARIKRVNHCLSRLLDYPEDELIGTSFASLFADAETGRELERRVAAGGDVASIEAECLTRGGARVPVTLACSRLVEADQGMTGVVCTLQDISERRRAEETISQFGRIVDEALNEVYIFDARSLRLVRVNKGARENLGFGADELLQLTPLNLLVDETSDSFKQILEPLSDNSASTVEFIATHQRKDGSRYPIEAYVQRSTFDGREVFVAMVVDISERKQTELALRNSERRFRALYDDNPSMFFTLSEDGTVLSVNRFGAAELGYRVEELVGLSVGKLHADEDYQQFRQRLQECLAAPDKVQRWELRKLRQDGTQIWTQDTARVIDDLDGNKNLLVVCEDITESHELSRQLSYYASHDALTGLVNRREFEIRLEHALDAVRDSEDSHALCYLDLDQFKVINDTCGHIAGDFLLRQVAGLLNQNVSKRDTLARLGGDEFGILMEKCTTAQAMRLARALRKSIGELRFSWKDKTFTIGASIGLVPIDRNSRDINSLLSAADAACYSAKDEGRNRIHTYRDDDEGLVRRQGEMEWVARINRALDENRFHLAYQNIVPVSGDPGGGMYCEVLLRMRDEDGRVIMPGAFLGAAERFNLSTKLDRWVVHTAFNWFSAHPSLHSRLGLMAINLSGQSLGDEEFLEYVIQQVANTSIPTEKICFEVTETAAISNLGKASRFIGALKQLDFQFALDDFGSGLSSFGYLKNLPVDFLKIDGSFVKDIASDPIDFAMVKAINEIGKVMGKKTVAEFVENNEILEKIREIGVDFAQGYGIAKPKPLSDLEVTKAA